MCSSIDSDFAVSNPAKKQSAKHKASSLLTNKKIKFHSTPDKKLQDSTSMKNVDGEDKKKKKKSKSKVVIFLYILKFLFNKYLLLIIILLLQVKVTKSGILKSQSTSMDCEESGIKNVCKPRVNSPIFESQKKRVSLKLKSSVAETSSKVICFFYFTMFKFIFPIF